MTPVINGISVTDVTAELANSPNEIDTVFFEVTRHGKDSNSQEIHLNLWARGCTTCTLSGVITHITELVNPNGTAIPIASLRTNRKYEAMAIIFAKQSGGLIQRIVLSEPL